MGAFVFNYRDGMTKRYTRDKKYWVEGTELNDTIVNGGYYDSYDYYSLQSDHYHRGDEVTINGFEGADIILNYGDNVTISGGTGDDSIYNDRAKNVVIEGDNGTDTITSWNGQNVSIDGGMGDDEIYNEGGSNSNVYGGNGNDTIKNTNSKAEIDGGDGNDSIYNYSYLVTIYGSSGNDTIYNYNISDVTIYGGADKDSIVNSGYLADNIFINGGDDDDYIENIGGSNISILGNKGNDSIVLNFNNETIIYNVGDGNDTINKFNSTNMLSIIGGSYSTLLSSLNPNDVIVKVGNESITLVDAKNKSLNIVGNNSSNNGNIIYGTSGDNDIENSRDNIKIEALAGKDSIRNSGKNVTILGGLGNDSIYNNAQNVSFQYASGDGDDTIEGFNATSTLSISSGSYSSLTNNNDVIIKVGEGSITLKDAKNTPLNIIGTYTPDMTPPDNEVSFISYDQFTPEELQKLQESSINSLKILGDSFEEMNIEDLTFEECNNDPKIFAESKKWTKLTKFLAKMQVYTDVDPSVPKNTDSQILKTAGMFSILADLNDVIVEVQNNFLSNEKNNEEKKSAAFTIASKVMSIMDATTNFSKTLKDFGVPFMFLSSTLGFIANTVAPMDNVKEKRQSLEKSYIAMTGEASKFFVKQLGGTVGDTLINKAINRVVFSDAAVSEVLKATNTKILANKIVAPLGPADACIAFLTGAVLGVETYNDSIAKYSEDKIPTATRDAILDSVVVGFIEGAHKYLYGADELIIQVGAWIGALLTGNEPVDVSEIEGGYIEGLTRSIKYLFFNEISGTDKDDVIESTKDKELIYGGFGADSILNHHSNVSIYSGADDDEVISETGSHNNYIDLGLGNDSIHMHDNNSTVHGGNDKDTLVIMSNDYGDHIEGNNIYGDSGHDYIRLINTDKSSINGGTGNDQILIEHSDNNTVRGGSGDDYIELQDSSNNTIVYRIGDGEDVIVGYDENDIIKFETRFTEGEWSKKFNTIESGNNIILKVEDKQIILQDAKDKKLNVESNFLPSSEDIRKKLFNINPIIMKQSENLNLRSSESPKAVSLSSGNQIVQFNDKDGNIAVVDENATGRKNIVFGKGDDLGVFTSPYANVKVTVGSGYDSIVVDNNARVNVDMSKASDAIIIANNSKVTLTNYDASSNAGILVSDIKDITSAVKNNSIQLVNDEVQLDSSTSIKISDNSNDSTIVNLITDDGDIQKVGFTGINGGSLDSSKLNGDFLLKGNYAESSYDKQGSHGSNIIASNGNDTILAGARDTINGGNGHNQIFLTPHDLRENKSGATIVLSDKGRNTVQGFNSGFESNSDCVKIDEISDIKFDFKDTGLILTCNNSRLLFDGIGATESEEPEKISLLEGDSTVDAVIAQTNQSISVNNDIVPDAFFGNRSGLNFNDYNGDININLAQEKGTIDGTDSIIRGFNKLQAGDGRNTLIGSNSNDTLIAGNGYTNMWSGAGNDKLFGKRDSEKKDGFTTFFFNSGDDHDTIVDFEFLTQDNRDEGTADKIDIASNAVTDVYHSGSDVILQINGSNDYLTIKDAFGKDFQINNLIAKVDRNITYDGLANYYVANGGSSLTVDSSIESAEIWLDNSHGTIFIGNIRTLDASAVEGNTSLVGNEFNNTIIAGKSDASLWGGFSNADDLLIGGNSRNTFFYCLGNGNDTITGVTEEDGIILSNVTLDQITETKITADFVSINFIDGGSLQINGSSDITYQLADGSKYSANHERLEWNSK